MIQILKKNNIMLDIETMGNGSNSAIVVIGAVRFTNTVDAKFYQVVTLESCIKAGLELDADTIIWWMQQGQTARTELGKDAIPLRLALEKFATWIGKAPVVWGNGAAFDNVIMANAYKVMGMRCPWHYFNDMCYRTLKNLNPGIDLVRQGTHHKADDDAESQANHLIRILKETQ